MATVNNQNEEDLTNQEGGTQISGTAGASEAGNPNPGVANSPVKQDATAQNTAGYTDVGSYLDANKSGSAKMGQDVANNLSNRYDTTKQGVQTSANDLINQVNQGYAKENTDLIKQVASNPYAAVSDPNQVTAFQGQLNDTYTGPNSWGDYGTQQGKVNEANQYAGLANTPGGTNVYAQELEGPTASQGVNQLDSLLLRSDPNAQSAIKGAANKFTDLNDYLNQQNTGINSAITGAQSEAQRASQGALDAFIGANGTLTNLNSTIGANTAAAQAKAQQENEAIRNQLNGSGSLRAGGFSPQVLQSLGLTAEQGEQLTNLLSQNMNPAYYTAGHAGSQAQSHNLYDMSAALSQQDPTQAITAANVATPEQYQQMSAIQQLLGSKTPQGSAINPALASLAGTVPQSLNQFDYQGMLDYARQVLEGSNAEAQYQANFANAGLDASHAASKQHGVSGSLNRALPNVAKYAANPLAVVPATYKATKEIK